MILVTAANGNQGRVLIPKLVAAGHSVRALRLASSRDDELLQLGAIEVVAGDAADRSVLQRACEGVDTIYHVGPSAHPLEREMGFAIIDTASKRHIKHLIFSSALHPVVSKLIQHKYKRDVEEHLIESGLNFTILQPSNYMLPVLFKAAFDTGVFRLSWDLSRRQAMIDLHDFADVVVKVATEGVKHYGATYELSSPGAHSAEDIRDALQRASGKPISIAQVTPDSFLDAWFGTGSRNEFKHHYAVFRAISLWYSQYDSIGNSNVLGWLLGRPPTTLDQCIAREWKIHRPS